MNDIKTDEFKVKEIEEKIGYSFKNKLLLKQAFTRSSYSQEHIGENDNEVLEFIGDSILGMVVAKHLSMRYKKIGFFNATNRCFDCELDEAELSEMKIKLVQRTSLAAAIEKMGLESYLRMSKGDTLQNVQNEDSVKEDLFESILGAVAIDSNWNICKIETIIKKLMDIDSRIENGDGRDYKEILNNKFGSESFVFSEEISLCENLEIGCSITLGDSIVTKETYYGYGNTTEGARRMAVQRAEKCFEIIKDRTKTMIEAVGAPDIERAVNQLQELYQKKLIAEPKYIFSQMAKNKSGNDEWSCYCVIEGLCFHDGEYIASSKNSAKKLAAFSTYNRIIGRDLSKLFVEEGEENNEYNRV